MPNPQITFPPLGKTVVVQHTTPRIEDEVLLVRKDKLAVGYKEPPLGTPHPDADKYPSHVLAAISDDADGQKVSFFYAKPLAEQASYSWNISYPYVSVDYPRVTRIYYVLRSTYEKEAELTPDPDSTRFPNLVHVGEETAEIDDPEGHVYKKLWIQVTRVYEKIPGPSLPGKSKSVPRRTPEKFITLETTNSVKQVVAAGSEPDTPVNENDQSTVTPINTVQSTKETSSSVYTTVGSLTDYAKSGEDQLITIVDSHGSDGSAPSITATTEVAEVVALGGGQFERRIGNVPTLFDARTVQDDRESVMVARHVERFLQDFKRETITDIRAESSPSPDSTVTGGVGTVSSTSQRVTDLKSRHIKTVVSGTPVTLHGVSFDEQSGLLLPYSEQLVAAGTAGTALQSDGTYAEIEPISPDWSIKTTRKATALTTRTYTIIRPVSHLPLVLDWPSGEFFHFYDKDGNIVMDSFNINYLDYNGDYVITVQESWQSTPFTGLSTTNLRARGFSFVTPYGSHVVQPCLHGDITVSGTTSDHETKWQNDQSWSFSFAATNPSAMPGTVIISDTQTPHRGGFLRIKETITPTV